MAAARLSLKIKQMYRDSPVHLFFFVIYALEKEGSVFSGLLVEYLQLYCAPHYSSGTSSIRSLVETFNAWASLLRVVSVMSV